MKNFKQKYVKYLIKSSVLFYIFLMVGTVAFVIISLNIKLDVTETFSAVVSENQVIINEKTETISNEVYLYTDKNEKIYKVSAKNIKIENEKTVFVLEKFSELKGEVSADIIVGEQTLLGRIFVEGGKG